MPFLRHERPHEDETQLRSKARTPTMRCAPSAASSLLPLVLAFAGGAAPAASAADPIPAGTYACPPPGDLPVILSGGPLSSPSPGALASVSLSIPSSGGVCVLSLLSIPVARSYGGREWEVRAGPFAGKVLTPTCDAGAGMCKVVLPADEETLPEGVAYALKSYGRDVVDKRTEAARFLEQTTFGPTLSSIDSLASTGSASSPDFASWVERQMDAAPATGAGLSSHREFFRRHTNPRFEYPYVAGGAGPLSACDYSSRWRSFALTERDGLVDFKTGVSKYLSIKELNGPGTGAPYVWMVEGMARTVTQTIGSLTDGDGNVLRAMEVEPEMYKIAFQVDAIEDNHKSSCVGCPVPVCVSTDGLCGFVENPKVDITGMETNPDLMPYSVVSLPDVHGGISMVPVDDGPYLPKLSGYQAAGDEFWLNATIDPSQCSDHPSAILPVPSKLDDATSAVQQAQHVEAASAPIFGHAINAQTGGEEALLFDPRFQFKDNTVENPLMDGGGAAYLASASRELGYAHCSNAPRTFLNEDHCRLSFDTDACQTESAVESVPLTASNLLAIRQLTGRFVVAVDGLPLDAGSGLPCAPSASASRWALLPNSAACSTEDGIELAPDTVSTMANLLDERRDGRKDYNPTLKDVRRVLTQCDPSDEGKHDLGHVAGGGGGSCWRHVHPDHLNVYDLTGYTHPGMGQSIEDMVGPSEAVWTFPASSATNQDFVAAMAAYTPIGKLDDLVALASLPPAIASNEQVIAALAAYSVNPHGDGVVVCGSPGEVGSDWNLGGIDGFDVKMPHSNGGWTLYNREIYKDWTFMKQKHTVWAHLALGAPDQLRQRAAWALHQILPIAVIEGFSPETEIWTSYYDIFVRNAFGNYRDVLREVSYNNLMGEWLSFVGNTAVQAGIDRDGRVVYPDENYAREVMQLFSVGLFQLNMDGTKKLENGEPIPTYTNDDVMSYSRAWTGFSANIYRGNNEPDGNFGGLRNDPMWIDSTKRDVFPKSDLTSNGYVGDFYPLCSDLPPHHHLREGATYRLLGASSAPQLHSGDGASWENNPESPRLALDVSSPLYELLCAPNANNGGECTYPAKVVLGSTLDYSAPLAQSLSEYIPIVRTVCVSPPGSRPVYYEYVCAPCVKAAFFSDAKRVIRGSVHGDNVVDDAMCADPRTGVAGEACCLPGWEGGGNKALARRRCTYSGERMTFDAAVDRCATEGMEQCSPMRLGVNGDVQSLMCFDDNRAGYLWTTDRCAVRAKIGYETGMVARVDHPEADWGGQRNVPGRVGEDTVNYFPVHWNEGKPDLSPESCDANSACYSVADGCVCDTSVAEAAVFASSADIVSGDAVLSALKVGAFPVSAFDAGTYTSLGDCGIPSLQIYVKGSTSSCSTLDADAVIQLTDDTGAEHYLKNAVSTVSIAGFAAPLTFRNPVHFADLLDMNARDMIHETEAVLDTYFRHPSHPPFLAGLMIQRFGVSNPSPRYVESVASAYKEGSFMKGRFGKGEYGDLEAMIAAILLDPESRSPALDADPAHGQAREPLLKSLSFLRSLELGLDAPLSIASLGDLGLSFGQGSYRAPSVFSFFLPDFVPSGAVGGAGLVSPESQVLDAGKIFGLMDGMFTTVKFGITDCWNGFGGTTVGARPCDNTEGTTTNSLGQLTYSPAPSASLDDVLDELGLLLTSSRLTSVARTLIRSAVEPEFLTGDTAKAVRIAQQLIASSPEFHSSNLPRLSGAGPRQLSGYSLSPAHDYRAVVFLMLVGGADSFNLLVPKSGCMDGRDVFAEYTNARGAVAMGAAGLLDIDATGSGQVCGTFGVHGNLPVLKQLYDEGMATFFANTGVLTQPLTKHDDYFSLTKVQLGAHNHMQRETYEVDTRGIMHGSGVGGRILDVLNRHGHQTSANAVEGRDTLVKGSPNDNNPVWTVSERSPGIIDQISSLPDGAMLDLVKQLNGEGEPENSLYGETWSAKLSQSLFQYEESHRMQTELEGLNFTLTSFPESPEGTLDQRFKSLAEYMSTRHLRKVDREVFVLSHEGYDMHRENTLGKKFSELNASLQQFIEELKAMGIWEDTALVMGSDFGRSVTANSNGGTDHAWGGNYFLLGGSVDGGKILGTYPEFLDERSDYWTGRGRMIPTTPWESVWNGIGQWMGVRGDNDLGWVLPNRNNFDKCALFSDQDLFLNGEIPQTACLINDGDGDGVADEVDQCPNSQYWTGLASDASGCQPPTAGPTTSPTLVPQPTIAPSSAPSVPPTPAPTVFGVLEVTPKASVITPDSAIVRVGGSNNHAVGRAIDGTTDKYEVHMSDAAKTGAGFEVTPFWPHSIVQGIRVYTASDGKSRDPTQFVVEGRNREGEAWTLIAGGDLNLSVERNPQGVPIDSSPSAPDLAKAHQEVTFQNTAAYSHYRVTFPETRSTSSTIVQFGEVELPGVWVPPGFVMTEYPTPAPSPKPTPAPTAVPTFKPTAAPSIAPTAVVTPVSTVLTPGSTVVRVRGYNTHTTATAIDGTTDVYQVHADGTGAPGFQVTPLWPYSIVQGIRVYTPYNGHSRDPMKFIVEGRNGDTEGWTIIAEGDLGLTTERNPSGMAIESTPTEPDMAKIHDEVLFQNTVMYSQYRVTFPEARSGSVAYGTIVQFGEVELPGLTVPPGYVLPTVTPVSTVLTPGSTVVRVRGYNTHTTATAIDGTTDVYQVHADGTGAPGFEVSPLWPYSIVQGIRVYTPHNGHGRDPMQFIVEGRNGDTEGWSVIALGDLGLTTERNPAGTPINSSPSAPDTSLVHDEVLFQNTVVYSQYRVTFPEARSALMAYGTIVQFGEVELPGLTVPPGLFVMTPYPTATPTAAPVAAAESNAIPVSTVLDAAAAPSIVRLNDIYPTHWYHNNVNIMDGTTSIYEIRMDGSGLPSGLEVTPTWPHSVIKSMRVYTARNGNSRDPTSFVIKGRNTDGEAWTLIAEGALYLPTDRNSVGLTVNSSPSAPDMALNHYEATFPNAVAYSQYQLTFPTTRHPDSTIVQFAELELPGLAVPEGWTCGGPGASCGNSHECCSEFCLGTGVCSDVTTQ